MEDDLLSGEILRDEEFKIMSRSGEFDYESSAPAVNWSSISAQKCLVWIPTRLFVVF